MRQGGGEKGTKRRKEQAARKREGGEGVRGGSWRVMVIRRRNGRGENVG